MNLIISKSDIGVVRKKNEDYCWGGTNNNNDILLVVCDGLGSYEGSHEASKIAVEVFKNSFLNNEYLSKNIKQWFKDNISKIKNDFNNLIKQQPKYKNMSTTIVLTLIIKKVAYTFWIGDSRAYILKKDNVYQITKDHNLFNYLKNHNTKEELYIKYKNDLFSITNFIDKEQKEIEFDFIEHKLKSKDIILLTSDGLHNFIDLENLYQLLKDEQNIEDNKNLIIKMAIENNSDDNISFVSCYKGK